MSEDYEVGYKKPPVETRFGAGNNANPNGKTSAHRKAEIRAAELAAKVQLDLVEALANAVDECGEDKKKLAYLNKEVNALLKNAQDRGYGAPKSSVDLSSQDGTLTPPQTIQIVPVSASKRSGDDW